MLKPTVATLAIIDAMAFWNDYLLPSLILGRKELYTLPIATQVFYGTFSTDIGLIMAALSSGNAAHPDFVPLPSEIYCGRCYSRRCEVICQYTVQTNDDAYLLCLSELLFIYRISLSDVSS